MKHIPTILLENKPWIDKQFLKIAEQTLKNNESVLPDNVFLRAIHQTWAIQYIESRSPLKMIARPHQDIVIMGDIQKKMGIKKLLIQWLKKLAKVHLAHQLNLISDQTKLSYEKITIRDQETRWGSCTKDKSISLNYKLLFLPEHLSNHILIHELCHTVHLNHSDKFWKLVEKFDPDCQTHRAAIKKAHEFVPGWL